ncbi:hypothetical protein QBC43DRAFT_327957 [Cladorrhinum sp. PSN259]|nr:hypothetical protein QBC43DRAFT_327957 [Cladorrhinum sp. PSN259]
MAQAPCGSQLRQWCAPTTVPSNRSPASDAFNETLKRFTPHATSIHDVRVLVSDSFNRYSNEHKFPKAHKWLSRVMGTLHHYANIFDVFVQHHPEYVALAWGAMKLVLVAVQNHQNTIAIISKALSQIAQSLPQVELATVLYPTEHMSSAVEKLYSDILQFFLRAYEWCQEGSFRHLLHSVTRPPELRYRDLLEQIAESSRFVDRLAVAGQQAEIRDMNGKLTAITVQLQKIQDSQFLHSSALVDTNRKLSDIQFSQIMKFVSEGELGDPLLAYRFNKSLQTRLSPLNANQLVNQFWKSPKLHEWDTGIGSNVAVIKGNLNARFAIKRFTVDIIAQLQTKEIPVLWALPWPDSGAGGTRRASSIDLFKHLVLQALRLTGGTATEGSMSLDCARFQRAKTELEWTQILGSALSRTTPSQIYLVIDLSILDPNLEPSEGFSWLEAFRNLFSILTQHSPNLKVKILLLSYGRNHLSNSQPAPSDIIIPVRAIPIPVKRQKRMGAKMHRGREKR